MISYSLLSLYYTPLEWRTMSFLNKAEKSDSFINAVPNHFLFQCFSKYVSWRHYFRVTKKTNEQKNMVKGRCEGLTQISLISRDRLRLRIGIRTPGILAFLNNPFLPTKENSFSSSSETLLLPGVWIPKASVGPIKVSCSFFGVKCLWVSLGWIGPLGLCPVGWAEITGLVSSQGNRL